MLDRKEKTSEMQVETHLLEGQNDGQDADGDEDDGQDIDGDRDHYMVWQN